MNIRKNLIVIIKNKKVIKKKLKKRKVQHKINKIKNNYRNQII